MGYLLQVQRTPVETKIKKKINKVPSLFLMSVWHLLLPLTFSFPLKKNVWFRRTKPLAVMESEIKLVRKRYSLVTTIWFMENRGDTVFSQMIFDSFLNLPFNYLSHLDLEYLCHGKTQRGKKKSRNIIDNLFRFWFFQPPFLLHQQRE